MPRPTRLNDKKAEVIEENFLKQDPEGFRPANVPDDGGLVVSGHVPQYKRVVFLNGLDAGLPLTFHYASATHPLKHYTLYHGQEDNIPLEVIKNVEECAENQYAYRTGRNGHPEMYVKSRKYLYQFRDAGHHQNSRVA